MFNLAYKTTEILDSLTKFKVLWKQDTVWHAILNKGQGKGEALILDETNPE
jgi:hypothetical protein